MKSDALFVGHTINSLQHARVELDAQSPATAFEGVFVKEIFKAMRATVHESEHSFSRSVFTDMLDEQLAEHIAESGGLGLTRVLEDEFDVKDSSFEMDRR